MNCWNCRAENDLSLRQTCERCGAPLIRSSGVFHKSLLLGAVLALVALQFVCVFRHLLR
ncbi:MAG: hypothetical protein WAU32_16185 [Thermoanaerobaculia bacterium]